MDTPASASGSAREAMIPVSVQSRGPSHFKIRHPLEQDASCGRLRSGQTIDNSSRVREIDTKSSPIAHSGTGVFGSKRQIAYRSGSTANVRSALALISFYPFPEQREPFLSSSQPLKGYSNNGHGRGHKQFARQPEDPRS